MASPTDTSGTGTPENSVVAIVGSTYRDKAGGASTTLYLKESGSGNTGWVAVNPGGAGVTSYAKSGSTALTGAVTISGGSNVTLTQSGQNVSIAANTGVEATFLSTTKWGAD